MATYDAQSARAGDYFHRSPTRKLLEIAFGTFMTALIMYGLSFAQG